MVLLKENMLLSEAQHPQQLKIYWNHIVIEGEVL